MKKLQTKYAKEVAYQEISGTPGLLLRRGNTRHSYEWLPVVPSPIASRTRNRTDFKTSSNISELIVMYAVAWANCALLSL